MRVKWFGFIASLTLMVAVSATMTAFAQERTPTIALRPADSKATDPNLGGWFVFELSPGETAVGKARLTNVSEVPMRVKLYFADLTFSDSGTPAVKDTEMTDVGTWGRFLDPDVTLDPKQTIDQEFEILVPAGVEPGDHIGVVVAESEPLGGNIRFVPRVATRVYITVPGDVTKSLEIRSVKAEPDSFFLTSDILVTTVLRNTGRIRLHPIVTVKGRRAEGAETLLSRSVERYVIDLRVPWYGGPIKIPVEAKAEGGLTRRVNTSVFVFPWLPLMIAVGVAAAYLLFKRWWRARASRLAGLQADIRRLESLITERPLGTDRVADTFDQEDDVDEEAALLSAYKRVTRTGSSASLPRIAMALHEIGSRDALRILTEALPHAKGTWLEAVEAAIATYADEGGVASSKPSSGPKPKRKPPPRSKKTTTPPHKSRRD